MFESILIDQNPHWDGDLYDPGIEREVFATVARYLPLPHVISVTGVRRAGKSILLKQAINYLITKKKVAPHNILFTNLEHPYFSAYSTDVRYLEQLFEDYFKLASPKRKIYCFLDEVQFFENWPVFVKAHYEQKNVKFFISGSNSFLMSHELLTLLSGRTLPIEVFPLSFREIIRAKTPLKEFTPLKLARHRHELRRLLDRFLRFGGFPEILLLSPKSPMDEILTAYSKTMLYQDVAKRLSLKKPQDLERLFYYLTSHIGTHITYHGLAELFALSDKTIKEYIEALINANLLFEISKFSFSLQQQMRAPKKIYSIDTGMVNAIAFKFSNSKGRLFENVVFLELKRAHREIYYYKTASDWEIDFVIKEERKFCLIQVCADLHDNNETREVRALVQAAKELHLKSGLLITADVEKDWHVEGIHIHVKPLYKFLGYKDLSVRRACADYRLF